MVIIRKMFVVLMCIVVSIMALGCSKNDEFQGDYKLIRVEANDESKRDERFFQIYEKYDIFYATLTIEEDGNSYIRAAGIDEIYTFSYDDMYFIYPESKKKDRYKYENSEISISESSLFGSAKVVFKKMTPKESEKLKNGYLEEDYHRAEKEAEEEIIKYMESLDESQISIVERTRIATDKSKYEEIAEVAKLVSFANKVEKALKEGHTYTISFSKKGIVIYLDSEKTSEEDPFCAEFEKRISDYKEYKVSSLLGREYIIDVLPDGTVRKTKAP